MHNARLGYRAALGQERILKFNLENVEKSLIGVEKNWKKIDDELDREKLGRRDIFDSVIRGRMMDAYRHLDDLLRKGVEPFSINGISEQLELNNLVHYGVDMELRLQFNNAIMANSQKFYTFIDPIENWYRKHTEGRIASVEGGGRGIRCYSWFPPAILRR